MLEPQTQTNFGSGIKEESRPKTHTPALHRQLPVQNE